MLQLKSLRSDFIHGLFIDVSIDRSLWPRSSWFYALCRCHMIGWLDTCMNEQLYRWLIFSFVCSSMAYWLAFERWSCSSRESEPAPCLYFSTFSFICRVLSSMSIAPNKHETMVSMCEKVWNKCVRWEGRRWLSSLMMLSVRKAWMVKAEQTKTGIITSSVGNVMVVWSKGQSICVPQIKTEKTLKKKHQVFHIRDWFKGKAVTRLKYLMKMLDTTNKLR